MQCFFLCLDALLTCRTEKETRIINILITKRCSIIAPKSHDNYLVHPNGVTFAMCFFSGALIRKFTAVSVYEPFLHILYIALFLFYIMI